MSFVRTALIIAAGIALLPTDEAQQAKLRSNAAQAVNWTMTYCDRNKVTCAAGAELWAGFLVKADFAGKVVYGLITDAGQTTKTADAPRAQGGAAQPAAAEPAPRRQLPLFERGTLTDNDLRPQWRGNAQASNAR